jgi:hypothetical protein
MQIAGTHRARTIVQEYQDAHALRAFQVAVSLHAHTHYSKESMGFAERYIDGIPLVARFVARERRAYAARNGRSLDFSDAWWHPPLDPQAVWDSERSQIIGSLGLAPLVSITDHDDIHAGLSLQWTHAETYVPVSVEWTVPFGDGFFHVGVHNLRSAPRMFERLEGWTVNPNPAHLGAVLEELNADQETLVVLNHPLWDLARVGASAHVGLLHDLLTAHGAQIHALELNGYRPWAENREVAALSRGFPLPLISGGDRHGRAANSLLNLTTVTSFGEFVREIREDRRSEILVMPSYQQALVVRKLAVAADVARFYPAHPAGQQHWADRITCRSDGLVGPLSEHWPNGGPLWARAAVRTLQGLAGPPFIPVARAMIAIMRPPSTGSVQTAAVMEAAASRRGAPVADATE